MFYKELMKVTDIRIEGHGCVREQQKELSSSVLLSSLEESWGLVLHLASY